MAVQWSKRLYCFSKFLIFQEAECVAPGKCRPFNGLRLTLPAFCVCILLVARLGRKEIQAKLFNTDKGSLCPVLSFH